MSWFNHRNEKIELNKELVKIEKKFPFVVDLQEHIFITYFYKTQKLYIEECCDNFFDVELTSEDCEQLSNYFRELANLLKTIK